jgi:protein SCO1/2
VKCRYLQWITCLAALLVVGAAHAAPAPDVTGVGFNSKLGASVDGTATFHDEFGQLVTLRSLYQRRPSILLLGYFRCPNLCSTVRTDAVRALARSGLDGAKDYSLLAVSIDPHESAADARQARKEDLAGLDAAAAAHAAQDTQNWHYLTGDPAAIAALTDTVGFVSRYDAATEQFVHPPGLVVLTPNGKVSGYLLGVGFRPEAVRDALRQADRGVITRAFAPLALLCFSYDAHTGRYTLAIMKVLRLGAILTVLVTAGVLLLAHRPRKALP